MKTVGAFVVVAALLVAIAFGTLYVLPGGWGKPTATMKFIVSDLDQGRVLSDTEMSRVLNNELVALMSKDIARDTLLRPRVKDTGWYRAHPSAEAAVYELQRAMRAELIEGTSCIELSLSLSPGEDAVDLLYEYAATYLNRKRITNDQASSSLARLYVSELTRASDDVRALRREIDHYYLENDILPLETASGLYLDMQRRYLDTTQKLEIFQIEYRSLAPDQANLPDKNGIAPGSPDAVSPEPEGAASDALPEEDDVRIADLELQISHLSSLISTMTPQLDQLASQLADRVQKEYVLERFHRELEVLEAKQQKFDTLLDDLRVRSNSDNVINIKKLSDPQLN